MVTKYTGQPQLVAFTAKLIKKADVPARDELALIRAIQLFAQKRIKYFREYPERFVSPMRTIEWGIADCDDLSILILTMARSFRIKGRLKFLRMMLPDGKRFSHVYPQVKIQGKWISVEAVRPYPLGKDPERVAIAKGLTPVVELIGDK